MQSQAFRNRFLSIGLILFLWCGSVLTAVRPSPVAQAQSACSGGSGPTLYVRSPGSLCQTAGTLAASESMASAGGINRDGVPTNPLTYTSAGLTGTYGGGATTFRVYIDAGTAVGNAVQAQIRYDFTGDGTWDRTELYNYYATDPVAGWEEYHQGSNGGLRSATGAFAALSNGRVQIQLWNALGNAASLVRVNATIGEGMQSSLLLPYTNVTGGTAPTATRTNTTTPSGTNLALNKPASGSTPCNATTETAPKAFDGLTTTKWCSTAAGTKTLTVDLAASASITSFVVKHAGAGGENTAWNTRDFTIQTSPDNATWTTRATVTGNTASQTTHPIAAVTARYVRLSISMPTNTTDGAARIYELEVYGTSTGPTPTRTNTGVPTATRTRTNTGVPPATATRTNTGVPPATATPTNTAPPSGQTPYGGTARSIPGTIQAEDFDVGGEGVAYHDLEVANQGAQYRTAEGVDIEVTTDVGAGYNVGWLRTDEWLEYTVNVQTAGTYNLVLRVASGVATGSLRVDFNGVDKTGAIPVAATGGWQTWVDLSRQVTLSAGQQIMRIYILGNDVNLNYVRLTTGTGMTATAVPPTPTRTSTPAAPTATRTRTNTPPPAGCGTANVAVGKPASASSEENATLTPSLAVDGNAGTRWASAMADPQWLQVDLGATMSICRIVLSWEAAYGSTYQLQVSNDGVNFTPIKSVSGENGGIDDHTGLAGSGRYVRMHGTARGTAWGYSLWEMEVYVGGSGPTATPPRTNTPVPNGNLALNRPATADSQCAPTEGPDKAVNGSVIGGNADKWCSGGATKWMQVDLGASFSLTRFVIKHAGAGGESSAYNTNAFNIQVSADALNWTTVVNVSGNTLNETSHLITPFTGRYVRLNVTVPTNNTDQGARIYELEVYGNSTGPTPTPNPSNRAPAAPVITEPGFDGKVANPGDVHMETGFMSDPDAGDTHRCTDWEIWTAGLTERVWFTSCIGGVERVHTHLGDGLYQGSHAGRTSLLPETNYVLRVRHRDSSNNPASEWSPYSQRSFRTSAVTIGDPNQKWALRQTGYELEIVASNLQLPVNIAFKPNAGTAPGDAYYYVTELYGIIKVVKRDGSVSDFATGLLNYNPSGLFPGSGEQGLTGIVVDPATGNVYASMLYMSTSGQTFPKVVRFTSTNNGLTAATQTTILDMPNEPQGQSHQVSNLTIGPDGKLYVHNGDGFDSTVGRNLNSFRGKILRMNLDGSPATDNPFYNATDGINSADYVYAYGYRNPFGGAWRQSDGAHYEVSNGPTVDRLAKVTRGTNYNYDGSDASMSNLAARSWPSTGVGNIAFVQSNTFSGSGFPADKLGRLYMSHTACTFCNGPSVKHLDEWILNADGTVLSGPHPLLDYTGTGKATVVGLVAGPDGLYFTDLYADTSTSAPTRGANVYRLRWRG